MNAVGALLRRSPLVRPRRYAVNSVHPFEKEIRHVSHAYTEGSNEVYAAGTYVLKPYHRTWQPTSCPSRYAIEYNEGLLTNEIRPRSDCRIIKQA
ncbi:MAG: hypothetical protein ACLU4J_10755 [Butyricimonas paravirosa]